MITRRFVISALLTALVTGAAACNREAPATGC